MYDNLTGLFELRGVRITEICMQSNATENLNNAQTHTEQSEVIGKTADDQQRTKVVLQIQMPMGFLWEVAVLCHFIVFVFLSLKPVAVGIQIF